MPAARIADSVDASLLVLHGIAAGVLLSLATGACHHGPGAVAPAPAVSPVASEAPPVPPTAPSPPPPPAAPADALALHRALFDEACARFEALGPFPQFRTVDEIHADGALWWAEREVMGAPLRGGREVNPSPARLDELHLGVDGLAWWRAALTMLDAWVSRWEVTADGGGYHPWLVLRSDTVFVGPWTHTLVCRSQPVDGPGPDPLAKAGCDAVLGTEERWWTCPPEIALITRAAFDAFGDPP